MRIEDVVPPEGWPTVKPAQGWPSTTCAPQSKWPLMIKMFAADLERRLEKDGLGVSQNSARADGCVTAYKVAVGRELGIPLHHLRGYAGSYWGVALLDEVSGDELREVATLMILAVVAAGERLREEFPPDPDQG